LPVMSWRKSISVKLESPKTLFPLRKIQFQTGYGAALQNPKQPLGVTQRRVRYLIGSLAPGLIGDGKAAISTQKMTPRLILMKCAICYVPRWERRTPLNGSIRAFIGLMALMVQLKATFMSITKPAS